MARDDNQDQTKDFLDIDLDDAALEESLAEADAEAEEVVRAPISLGRTGDGVLLFDNKRYGVGLSWLVADDEGDTELALMRAKDFKADFYCMRQGVVTQHGFGFLKKGHRIQMPALASVAADALVGEWHGVFVADNGWWYMAVHADNIAPDGDLLFASEEAAYNHFITQAEKYRWPRAYAPESWNIPDSSGEIPLSKIIGEATPPLLKPVNLDAIFSGRRNKNLAIVGAFVIVGLIILSAVGQQVLPSLVPQQALIPMPNVETSDTLQAPPREPMAVKEEESNSLVKMGLMQPSALMSGCLSAFASITKPLPGWALNTLRCKGTFIEGTWSRKTGSYNLIEPYLSQFPNEASRNFTDANTLLVTRKLGAQIPTLPVRDLYERNYAIMALNKRFADMGQMDVKEVIPAASQQLVQGIEMMQQSGFNNISKDKPELRPLTRDDLPYLDFTLLAKTPPNLIGPSFDLPGLIIQTVTTIVSDGSWKYEAKLILRPDQRLVDANTKARALQAR